LFPSIEELKKQLENLSEAYNIEVKSWIDPSSDEGKSKLVKACFALRNINGGILVFGFDNNSMLPTDINRPTNLRQFFEQEKIQNLISSYASDPFSIALQYVPFNGEEFPVICVPSGVQIPVAVKKELKDSSGNFLLNLNAIFFRTLRSNNIISSATIPHGDLRSLMEICFNNREADIGRFLRRHFIDSDLVQILNTIKTTDLSSSINYQELSFKWLNDGHQLFQRWVNENDRRLTSIGYFEFGAIIDGKIKESIETDKSFLSLISMSNRRLTGMPFFSPLFGEKVSTFQDGWEQGVDLQFDRQGINFWRIEPRGKFYTIRSLDEDFQYDGPQKQILSVCLPVWRVGEVIAQALAIAKGMVVDFGNSNLYISIRWTGLKGRKLSSWGCDGFNHAWIYPDVPCENFEASSKAQIPLDIPDSSLAQYIDKALKPLYRQFYGYEANIENIERIVNKMLKR
jgi:hypothetical protein